MQGGISQHKVRIIVRGFQQKQGTDYHDIFAHVVRWSTILVILALVAKHNWPLLQIDVITAFLNGQFNKEIFIKIPKGFPFVEDPMKACKITEALYGLKHTSKAWYERINSWLLSQGFIRSENNPNLYFSRRDGKVTILFYMLTIYL